jgi:hypothetical protein
MNWGHCQYHAQFILHDCCLVDYRSSLAEPGSYFILFSSSYTFNISIPLGWLKNPFSERKRFYAFSNTPISFLLYFMTFWTDMS